MNTVLSVQKNRKLRQERIQHNWYQADLAEHLGTTAVTVRRWERGTQQPSAYYRAKLCSLFGKSAQELGLNIDNSLFSLPEEQTETEARATTSSTSDILRLWTVPYARYPHFIGRDDLLEILTQQFAPRHVQEDVELEQSALTQTQAIYGLGGIGKTQIALEYAYRAYEQQRYAHTIWISAANEETILNSFVALADQLPDSYLSLQGRTDQRQIALAAVHWLEQCKLPWLLIFDNVDDLSLLPSYLPQWGNGNILLTTRAAATGSLAFSHVEVETMGLQEGLQFLLQRAQHLLDVSQEEIYAAEKIVLALGQLPLALDQAGAYIEETGCSFHDYLQLYRQHRYALLARRGKQTTGYTESVATTWSRSFARVERINPAAADLLHVCALLSPDYISEELLIKGAPHWPTALHEAVIDPLRFNQMIEDLLRFSFVKRHVRDRQLRLHHLVQVVQREQQKPEERCQWHERLILALNAE